LDDGYGSRIPSEPSLNGLYVEVGAPHFQAPVFQNGNYYLYRTAEGARWVINDKINNSTAIAYIDAYAEAPADLAILSMDEEWMVAQGDQWVAVPDAQLISSDSQLCYSLILARSGNNYTEWPDPAESIPEWEIAQRTCSDLSTTLEVVRALRNVYKYTNPSFILLNNVTIPMIGLGTGAANPEDVAIMVNQALKLGYKLLDTATAYENDEILAKVFQWSDSISRDEIFLTTKIWYTELGFQETLDAAHNSLSTLRTDYLDLLLLHWPQCYPEMEWMGCDTNPSPGTWQDSWLALEKLYAEGKVSAIGVSNFYTRELEELLYLANTPPMVVQDWMDPANQPWDVIELCRQHGIFFQAYSSLHSFLTPSQADIYAAEVRTLKDIGYKHHMTPVQVALSWMVQQQIGVIPRASSEAHLKSNLLIGTRTPLTPEDISLLNQEEALSKDDFSKEL
jgi:diketogulonate reductase-like aldo/keto reductase